MLNNLTNFFNLITSRKIKSVPEGTDLIPLATRDKRYSGNYQPTGITVDDFIASIPIPPAGVQSVTGLNTNNADPLNPVVQISVNGTTVTGTGRPDSPLAAPYQAPSVDGITITGTGAPGNPLIAAGGAVTYSNVFFVDPVNGNDATGAVNRFDKPYLTYNAASTAALALTPTQTAPALVFLRKGVYTDNMLLKPYVYVYCEESVSFTAGGFYDDINTVYSKVYGKACFYVNSKALLQQYPSDIFFEFDQCIQEATIFTGVIESKILSAYTNAKLHVKCNKIESNCKNGYATTFRGNVYATMEIANYLTGPGKLVNLASNAPSTNFSGKVIVICPQIISDNRTTTIVANSKSPILAQFITGTVEIYGDLINNSNNFTYSPGTANQQACICALQNLAGSSVTVYGNLYANETFGIYTISASGNDALTVNIKGNINSKSIPVCFLGHTNKLKIEGEITKTLNDTIAAPCIYAINSAEIYAKNVLFKNYNTVNSNLIALDSVTAKGYFYNCVAYSLGTGDVFLKDASTGTIGCVNVKGNVALGAVGATAAFTPQDYTQVTGLVLPNF